MGTVMIDNGKLSDEEYKCLREELLNHISCIQNYNIALYSTSALILSFTVSREEFYYSLLPLVVIIPLYILREKLQKDVYYIATYLYVFLEGETFNWERRHYFLDKQSANKKSFKPIFPFVGLIIICVGISVLKVYTSSSIDLSQKQQFYYLLSVVFMLSLCLLLLGRTNDKKTKKEYIERWNNVKTSLEECKSIEKAESLYKDLRAGISGGRTEEEILKKYRDDQGSMKKTAQ